MGFNLHLRYQHPDQGDEPRKDALARADVALARRVGTVLNQHYPGHPWFVEASHHQGVVLINIPALMGQQRYVIKIDTLKTDPGMRAVTRGAGEILERYRLPRVGFNADQFLSALKSQPIGRGHVPN